MPTFALDARPNKRKGFWYLIRRVPAEFRAIEPRSLVHISTGIRVADDPRGVRASPEVKRLDADLRQFWEDRRAGRDAGAGPRYQRAQADAGRLGFAYAPAAEVAALPLADILRRLEALEGRGLVESPEAVTAALGGAEPPAVLLSGVAAEYERIVAASIGNKSPRQKRRWREHREATMQLLIDALGGDRPVGSLTRADALAYRDRWNARVVAGEVTIGTANKSIGHIKSMLRTIDDGERLKLKEVFAGVRIAGGKDRQRVAYDPAFVQNVLLADGAFAVLNAEARGVIYMLVETGLRLSEACNLTRETIRLNGPVPYISIRPIGRDLKTDQSERDIPLVGVSLAAARAFPDGFPRYRDNADALSALVNMMMRRANMRPEKGQTLYSLRHTFEDRLTAVEAPEKLMAALMGHKFSRPRYGKGPSLEQKAEWLNRIAFRPPSRV